MTDAQRMEQYKKMFGCSKSAVDDTISTMDMFARLRYAMGTLSNAQEYLARGDGETARQLMNIAKYVIDLEGDRARVLATLLDPKCGLGEVARIAGDLAR